MARAIERELKRGTLEMILLKLLSERQMYGYELVSTLEQRGGGQFQLKEGTLYPVLYRLENDGLVETRWETAERSVPRKYYRLSKKGAAELDKLVNDWRDFTAIVNQLLGKETRK